MTIALSRKELVTDDLFTVPGIDHAQAGVDIRTATLTMHDDRSGTTLFVGTPQSTPDVWLRYLEGARDSYAAHGISGALDFDAVVGGEDTSLFCAAVSDDGQVIGGIRVQGPYLSISQSHALVEWEGQPGLEQLRAELQTRVDDGIVEVKTAYVNPHPAAGEVAGLFARVALILMTMTESRYVMATAADYVLSRWESGGGKVSDAVPATPYPDERYRTRVMFWDWQTLAEYARPEVWELMQREYALLLQSSLLGADRSSSAA